MPFIKKKEHAHENGTFKSEVQSIHLKMFFFCMGKHGTCVYTVAKWSKGLHSCAILTSPEYLVAFVPCFM